MLGIEQGGGNVATVAFAAYGYGALGRPDDGLRMFERLRELSADQYVDPVMWAWAYMGMGDYDEALDQLNAADENPGLIKFIPFMPNLRHNVWSDPMLEQPEFVEVLNRLRPTR